MKGIGVALLCWLAVMCCCSDRSTAQRIIFGGPSFSRPATPPTTTTARPPTGPSGKLDSPCRTPQDRAGLCQPVRQCGSLLEQLRKRNATYLKASLCGRRGRTPLLCCPDNVAADSDCGLTKIQLPFIVGGEKVQHVGELPWMVVLEYASKDNTSLDRFKCGGVIIGHQWIVTAAHCIIREGPVSARLGDLNLATTIDDSFANPPQDIEVEQAFSHPDFKRRFVSPKGLINDIALLKLKHPIEFSAIVKPICLPKEPRAGDNTGEALIAGWGYTEFGGSSSSHMRFAIVNFTDPATCKANYNRLRVGVDPGVHLCASGNDKNLPSDCTPDSLESRCQGGVDTCEGDSGGPLMTFEKLSKGLIRFHTVGVVSFAVGCGSPDFPGLYTRLDSFLGWIAKTIAQN